MKQVTLTTTNAFIAGRRACVGNTMTDGTRLYLHGNLIAEKRADGLYITNAGWHSNTTKERLNGLPGVRVYQKNHQWYLNGKEWGGEWVRVDN